MNCREWEERLALYAGGDLGGSEAEEVERHTAGCPGCQVAVSGLKQALETLRLGHEEFPPDAAFGAVRARVMATLRHDRRPVWKRAWIYGLAAAVSLALAAVLRLGTPSAPVSPVAVVRPLEPPARTAEAGRRAAAERRVSVSGPNRGRTAPSRARLAASAPASPIPDSSGRANAAASAPSRVASPVTREPLVVRYTTDNPDVVILWIAETTGEQR
jgi:Putative zinc-finger